MSIQRANQDCSRFLFLDPFRNEGSGMNNSSPYGIDFREALAAVQMGIDGDKLVYS
jgi:hypothetical protein